MVVQKGAQIRLVIEQACYVCGLFQVRSTQKMDTRLRFLRNLVHT